MLGFIKSKKVPLLTVLLIVLSIVLLIIMVLLINLNNTVPSNISNLEPRYIMCIPQEGIMDKFHTIYRCLQYAKKHNRVLIIDTTKDWFNDDINRYIHLHSSYVYTGPVNTIAHKISKLSTYPKNINIDKLDGIKKIAIKGASHSFYLNDICLSIDLDRDYKEDIVVYSNGGGGLGLISILEISTLESNVLDLYKLRRAQLPRYYVGIHMRNTDYGSDVPDFIQKNNHIFKNNAIFLASDNKKTIDMIKDTYGNNIYTFADIPDNDGKPIHEFYERTKEAAYKYNMDTIVDILLLAAADEYYFSCEKSGFSKTINELRKKPDLIKRILS